MSLTFIETQFPVSKVSKESYKERKANYSQTLTGLGKWWGRKPLILVRAALLGLLMPASADSDRDREIFLKILTMDDDGLWQRKSKNMTVKELYQALIGEELGPKIDSHLRNSAGFLNVFQNVRMERFEILNRFISKSKTKSGKESYRWTKGTSPAEKESVRRLVFESLSYDDKLKYCDRPEQIDGPSPEAWQEINAHLQTHADSLQKLFQELGEKRFGEVPTVGDAFCGGGSIPFEAARLGLPVYASDLNPVACLLTWAALNIVGGGEEVATEIRQAQEEIYEAVDDQVTDWGIEHNEDGHRADAYLYCMEVSDPETGWKVPLAPSWVIGEKTKCVAVLEPDEPNKRYHLRIKSGVSTAEIEAAKEAGTIIDNHVVHPKNPNPVPLSMIRREHQGGLRLWEKEDIVPQPDDVFQERLYCIRYVHEWEENGKIYRERYYREPTTGDLQREEKVLQLLRERFADWQEKGYIPERKIEPGYNTDQPIRERGWTHWHHLFNARQLLINGLFNQSVNISDYSTNITYIGVLLGLGKCADWNSKLARWDSSLANEKVAQTFSNQALNTMFNFPSKTVHSLQNSFLYTIHFEKHRQSSDKAVEPMNTETISGKKEIWLTDPPYADAVNYHELSDFVLSWYSKNLPRYFPDWYTDSRRALAIKGSDQGFRQSMVAAYSNLTRNMPDNGMQIVMFTHQDARVWADLALILWAAGLRVSAAWTIATETDSAMKTGNYVKGTVLLVLRKQNADETAFLDELNPLVELEVKNQLHSMRELEDKEDPNFGDADYQLAAYAAALRVLTRYKKIEDIDIQREISRERPKNEPNPLEKLIENAVEVACNYLIPNGISSSHWRDFKPLERFYLKGLEIESHGEYRSGVYQELARGYGVQEYAFMLNSGKANQTRLKTASEFGKKNLRDEDFGQSMLRNLLFAIAETGRDMDPAAGRNWLRNEFGRYWEERRKIVHLCKYFAAMGYKINHWEKDSEAAALLATVVENDAI